jgi:hypothetical protein
VVYFAESPVNTMRYPLASKPEVQSHRHGCGDLRPEISDLIEDCDQVGRSPHADQALYGGELDLSISRLSVSACLRGE